MTQHRPYLFNRNDLKWLFRWWASCPVALATNDEQSYRSRCEATDFSLFRGASALCLDRCHHLAVAGANPSTIKTGLLRHDESTSRRT
jgi:hypothetical protein